MIRYTSSAVSSRACASSSAGGYLSTLLQCRSPLTQLPCSNNLDRSLIQPRATPRRSLVIRASYEPNKQERGQAQAKTSAPFQFNPIYAAICGERMGRASITADSLHSITCNHSLFSAGGFAVLFLFQNPYIFAALTILIIIPQNSATTSLNSLVLLFYDSGIFLNFAEAVQCVRLVSWLSVVSMLLAFAVFA